jgi:hypothetical protein
MQAVYGDLRQWKQQMHAEVMSLSPSSRAPVPAVTLATGGLQSPLEQDIDSVQDMHATSSGRNGDATRAEPTARDASREAARVSATESKGGAGAAKDAVGCVTSTVASGANEAECSDGAPGWAAHAAASSRLGHGGSEEPPARNDAEGSTTIERGSGVPEDMVAGRGPEGRGGLQRRREGVPVETEAAQAADRGCLDVTLALQFQVQGGALSLSAGACKGNLLGFADLYPNGDKRLYVLYKHAGSYYEVEGMPHDILLDLA